MKFNKIYILLLLGFTLEGCSDFLEEYSQDKYLVTSYKDLDELLIGDCYMPVKVGKHAANALNPGHFIHFLADEIEEQNKGNNSRSVDKRKIKNAIFGYFTWQKRVGQNDTYTDYSVENATWKETYRLINVANNILQDIEAVPRIKEEDKEGALRVKGEASFLRAIYYFWLSNLYGKPYTESGAKTDLAVPLKIEAKVHDIKYQRNTLEEVYNQVLKDLDTAEECLSKTSKTKSIYRADINAVYLLKSRVYLYMQNWTKAASYADKVIQNLPGLVDMNDYAVKEGFLNKASVETIFSMGGNDVPCNLDYRYQAFRVSTELYNLYDSQDLRKRDWWWTYDNFIGYTKIPHSTKYSENSPTKSYYYQYGFYNGWLDVLSPVSDKFLFRTAEAYLNKAEAEAYLGNEDSARKTVNQLRKCRFITGTDYTIKSSGEQLVRDIRNERRMELALEGHRWFDLRRYSVCEKYPESKEIVHEYTYYTSFDSSKMIETRTFRLERNDPAYVLPIPQEVLEYNTGMKNNDRPDRKYTVKE